MGLFDIIKGAFNPETIATYNDLINNHNEAFRRWRGKQIVGTFSECFDFQPTFADKQYIANHRDDILAFEKIIAEEKAYFARRQQVIEAASKYPTAFRALVKKLSLPNIPELSATLPGERKSKRTKRIEEEARKRRQSDPLISSHFNAFQSIITNNPFRCKTTKRSLQTLKKEEYESLYSHLSELPSEETKLKKQLKQEDFLFSFEDNILDNDRRKEYCTHFLSENSKKETDYEYLTTHLHQLDAFIRQQIEEQYATLLKDYALGVKEYQTIKLFGESDLDAKEKTIKNKNRVIQLDAAKRKYNELKRKYPKGLAAFEQFNSYDDGKNSADLSLEEIVESEEAIAIFEKNADAHSSFLKWQDEQREFASISRNLCRQNFGCYFYDVPLKGIKADGTETSAEYRVWQHFYTSFYNVLPETTISEDFKYLSDRAAENSKFLTGGWNYKDTVYDEILELIKAIKEKVGDISIVFASNGLSPDDSFVFNHRKFEYLISKLDEADITYYEGEADILQQDEIDLTKHIIIFEFISTNARLRQTTEHIRKQFASLRPLITYVSLRKGYDFLEIEKLEAEKEEARKRKKAEEEAEKKRLQEERERKEQEENRLRLERERKKQELLQLIHCVQNWHTTRYGIKHHYIFDYLKTTAPRSASDSEWDIRHLIWAFKNDPNKQDRDYSYSEALDIIVPRYERVLRETFGNLLSKLTFVCLPASTAQKNRLRWSEFSQRICSELNMSNAFSHISIIQDAVPKHLGGDGNPELSFDETYFKDRYVIICDDIKTSGKSLATFQLRLNRMGAKVICAFTIGQTVHE